MILPSLNRKRREAHQAAIPKKARLPRPAHENGSCPLTHSRMKAGGIAAFASTAIPCPFYESLRQSRTCKSCITRCSPKFRSPRRAQVKFRVFSMGPPLTPNEALSGILGSVSLASWIFLLLPQLYENYTQHSAAGISVPFLLIWFAGDITNFAGAAWGGLIPTVIALAAYFCLSDIVLVLQCLYYNLWINRVNGRSDVQQRNAEDVERHVEDLSRTTESTLHDTQEDEPLLSRTDSTGYQSIGSNVGLPGSRRRRKSSVASALGKAIEDETTHDASATRRWIKNIVSMAAVCSIGTTGWAIAWKAGLWTPAPLPLPSSPDSKTPVRGMLLGAEILGYTSAVFYLGARVPQIVKNWKEQSCEGLSLLFFMLSLLGNLTYGAGVSELRELSMSVTGALKITYRSFATLLKGNT